MTHKLRQQLYRSQLTPSAHLPETRSSNFISSFLRPLRLDNPTAELRATFGLLNWERTQRFQKERRIMYRAACPLTGRSRGTSRRFSIARTRVKALAGQGKLFGLRKSSW